LGSILDEDTTYYSSHHISSKEAAHMGLKYLPWKRQTGEKLMGMLNMIFIQIHAKSDDRIHSLAPFMYSSNVISEPESRVTMFDMAFFACQVNDLHCQTKRLGALSYDPGSYGGSTEVARNNQVEVWGGVTQSGGLETVRE
jgi:hypothetical protein